MKKAILLLAVTILGYLGNTQTTLLSTINPDYTQYLSDGGVEMNGVLYYLAANSTVGTELWRTDGTADGTYVVKDIYPGVIGAFASSYFSAVVFQGYLYFIPRTPNNGFEIWRTDGTSNGTQLFYELTPGPASSNVGQLSVINNKLLFVAASTNSVNLYRLNVGVAPTATFLKSFETIYDVFSMGAYGVLSARQPGGSTGTDLWRTNGTPNGTYLLKDINPGAGNSFPSHFTQFGNLVMFDASTDNNGYELWRSDGSAGGTEMVMDINPGVNDALGGFYGPPIGESYGRFFYFGANDGVNGIELWRTNGTIGNAKRLTDVNQGSTSSLQLPNGIHPNLSKIIFRVQGQENCYSFDTIRGAVSISGFKNGYNIGMNFFDGIQYYSDQDSIYGDEFRKNDGTIEQKIQELSLHDNYQSFYTNSSFRVMGKLGTKIIFRHLSWQGTQYRAYEPTSNTCFAPEEFRSCWISSTRSDIIWNRIPGISRYQIDYKLSNATAWTSKISTKSFITLNNLILDSSYRIRFRSECNGVWTQWSIEKSFNQKQALGGYNATVIAERNQSPTIQSIFWNKSPGTIRAQIRYRPFNTTTWIKTVSNSTSRFTISGLMPNTFYEYEIRGFSTYWDTWRKQYFTTADDMFFKQLISNEILVDDNKHAESISPNPVTLKGIVNIRFSTEKAAPKCRLIVCDMTGKIIYQQPTNCIAGRNILNLKTDQWVGGIYSVSILDSEGQKLFNRKLIVQ